MRYFIALTLCLTVGLLETKKIQDISNWVRQTVENTPPPPPEGEIGDRRGNVDLTPHPGSRSCTENGVDGICVPSSMCDGNNKIGDPDDFTERAAGCSHYAEVCCPSGQVRTAPKPPPPPSNRGCGWSNPGVNLLRSKGDPNARSGRADFGDFPWMVALLKRSQYDQWNQGDYLGGGTLIHKSVVMTAAHKVADFESDDLKCRAGEWDTQNDMELHPHQERNVKTIIMHEQFLRKKSINNIALLIMEKPFELAAHIDIACLGQVMPVPQTLCYSMGWGSNKFNNKDFYAVTLKKIKLPLVDRTICENWLKKTRRLGSSYVLWPSLTCAGGEENVDTCEGDGGSPLVCEIVKNSEGTRYEVYGMVAYGVHGCGLKEVPGVYVNIPEMYSWIKRKMTGLNYEISFDP